jgi:hypothetical protein
MKQQLANSIWQLAKETAESAETIQLHIFVQVLNIQPLESAHVRISCEADNTTPE